MFLAFFPVLLFALGLVSTTSWVHEAMREIPARLVVILPPNSAQVVTEYFLRRGVHPQRWIYLGLIGTLITGSQVMIGFIEGFRMIEGDPISLGYWRRHGRACAILCATIVPILLVMALTVFGKSVRSGLIRRTGWSHHFAYQLSFALYLAAVLFLAMAVLIVLYRFARPGHTGIVELFPGAIIASILWWAADIIFGFYVRRVPWDVVYGGLAAAIGLLIWMYITAMIVLYGAAYNAEAREARHAEKSVLARQVVLRHPVSRS